MFDVFDIVLPHLDTTSNLEVLQQQTAFGPREERFAYFNGLRFAQVVKVKDAYSNVEAWTGSSKRTSWTALLAASSANEAASNDETWVKFLAGLVSVLVAHVGWQVVCESDCEQYPIETLELSPTNLSQLLDSYRKIRHFPIAIRVSAPKS